MKTTLEFLRRLESSPAVIRLKELKALIGANPEYFRLYNDFIELKKSEVRNAASKKETLKTTEIDDKLSLILSDPVVGEYIELLEELNETVQSIQELINQALITDM